MSNWFKDNFPIAYAAKEELMDPRFSSNVKGMLTGKSREERVAAHANLDQSKFRDVYGDDKFDNRVQEELTRAYKLYENGEMTNDEFKYIEASLDELKKNKESLISRNATFGVAPTTDEGIKKGHPRWKLMVMQDKNPFTKDLPQGNTMSTKDFR
tara:strand:- start:1846 stop:2310 length:465 start_codon:yes stop_codon:yes gene_type:complete